MFMGWSNIGFDDEMIRNEFFRGIRYPYITNATPNKRHDGLNIARGAHAVDESVLKTEINAKGNAVMKLESLARMNGFESSGAHSALFDAELTVKVLGLIKKNQPQTWGTFLRTANKVDTEVIIKKEKIFTLAEYHFGKNYRYVVSPLHPKHCIHPIYQWGQAVDLKIDPIPLLNMSVSELKGAIKKLKLAIYQINTEGKKKLIAAFDLVNKNFSELFIFLNLSLKLIVILLRSISADPIKCLDFKSSLVLLFMMFLILNNNSFGSKGLPM